MAGDVRNTGKFLRDVWKELKRVTWPTRRELVKYTGVVIATIFFISIFFAVVDLGLSALVREFLD